MTEEQFSEYYETVKRGFDAIEEALTTLFEGVDAAFRLLVAVVLFPFWVIGYFRPSEFNSHGLGFIPETMKITDYDNVDELRLEYEEEYLKWAHQQDQKLGIAYTKDSDGNPIEITEISVVVDNHTVYEKKVT